MPRQIKGDDEVKRDRDEKAAMLRRVRVDLEGLRPTAGPVLRESLKKRISELEAELSAS